MLVGNSVEIDGVNFSPALLYRQAFGKNTFLSLKIPKVDFPKKFQVRFFFTITLLFLQ